MENVTSKKVKKKPSQKGVHFFFCFWEQVGSTPRTLARCGVSYPDCVVVVFKVSVVFVILALLVFFYYLLVGVLYV